MVTYHQISSHTNTLTISNKYIFYRGEGIDICKCKPVSRIVNPTGQIRLINGVIEFAFLAREAP